MNTAIQNEKQGAIRPSELPDWLLSRGLTTITAEEASFLLGCKRNEVPQRLVSLRKKGKLVSLARGLWAAVSPEYLTMGAPEPMRYIDSLMKYYDIDYCIGWLSAASIHGARHQAPQVFQIATERAIRNRTIGRSDLQFYHRSYIQSITRETVSLSSGQAKVASPGSTMLMVAADLLEAGGIDNAATIIAEIADEKDQYIENLIKDCELFPHAAICRLGWILEHVAGQDELDELKEICSKESAPALLSPYDSRTGERDTKWNIIVNRKVEADI